jgi:hypothetical protein
LLPRLQCVALEVGNQDLHGLGNLAMARSKAAGENAGLTLRNGGNGDRRNGDLYRIRRPFSSNAVNSAAAARIKPSVVNADRFPAIEKLDASMKAELSEDVSDFLQRLSINGNARDRRQRKGRAI